MLDVMGSLVCVENGMVVSSVCKFECKGIGSVRNMLYKDGMCIGVICMCREYVRV